MKKVISVLLAMLMLFSTCVVGVVAIGDIDKPTNQIIVHSSRSQIPVIRILGDGEPLYNEKQEKIVHIRSLTFGSSSDEEDDDSDILSSVANVLLPFLIDGLLNDEWDAYYENLQKEISEIFSEIRLDNNGEVTNNTGISEARKKEMAGYLARDAKKENNKGYYAINDYRFWYDWRLDPIYTAGLLNTYIQEVKKATGCPKVSIMASCLGTIVTTTYINLYGTDDLHGVGFTGAVSGGAEALSEAISGKFDIDGYAISRTLIDSDYIGEFNVDKFITSSIDLLSATGVFDYLEEGVKETLYAKLVEGVTSALALSTLFTFPIYWAAVSPEDYDDALLYVFGPDGSEKRTTYAGLIEKIETYNREIRSEYDATIKSIGENGVKFGAVSKYGFQILPICQSYDVVSDQFVSVKHSSFGATTSTIFDTLTDDYIAERVAAGKGDYISPDKKIDASTCAYPESTWFMKNVSHSEYTTFERKLLYDVITAPGDTVITCGDTVNDLKYSRFLVYDYETDIMTTMTEENCNTENWEADKGTEEPQTIFEKILVRLTAFFNWIASLFNFLKK